MVTFGLDKFIHFMPMPMPKFTPQQMEAMPAFGKIKWIMPLTGFIEISDGVLFAIPKTRALGVIVILPVMAGILAHNLTFFDSFASFSLPLIFALINLWGLIDNRNKYAQLLK
jgi:putative oxidoreductase